MAKEKKICREWLIDEIQKCAKKNDGLAISGMVNSRVRERAVKEFGSWGAACLEAGVSCPSLLRKRAVKAKEKEKEVKQPLIDGLDGVEKRNRPDSICFDCARSAAPIKYRCSWDAALVLPKDAIYYKAKIKNAKGITEIVPIVTNCPNFVNNSDVVMRKMIRDERMRELEVMKRHGMIGIEAAKARGRKGEQ